MQLFRFLSCILGGVFAFDEQVALLGVTTRVCIAKLS